MHNQSKAISQKGGIHKCKGGLHEAEAACYPE